MWDMHEKNAGAVTLTDVSSLVREYRISSKEDRLWQGIRSLNLVSEKFSLATHIYLFLDRSSMASASIAVH